METNQRGRKPIPDKKKPVTIFMLESEIERLGGLDKAKDYLYTALEMGTAYTKQKKTSRK